MRRLLPLLYLLFLVAPAYADRDEEVALAGVLQQAHDYVDDSWLRRMMAPAELRRYDEDGGVQQFRRHRQSLGVAQLVSCAEGMPELASRLPTAAGDLLPAHAFRCELTCQRGAYAALITMSAADALVRPNARVGRVERLWLASPLLDRSPWPLFERGAAAPWLAGTLLLAFSVLFWGALRLTGHAPWPRRNPDATGSAAALLRAQHEVVLVLRLLFVLLLVLLCGPLFYRLGPWPLFGTHAMLLALGAILILGVGLLLWALGGYFHPRGGRALLLALFHAVGMLALLFGLLLRTALSDLPALFGQRGPPRQTGRYRLPLGEGPASVRHGGPLLDLVRLHDNGRSCLGADATSCRIFGAAVLCPADGVVLLAVDRYPDRPLRSPDRDHPMGNYLLISHDRGRGGERSLLTHLARSSLRVSPGQAVRQGDLVARVGNSGDSDEPHLSLELLPGPQALPGRRPPPFCGAAFDPEQQTGIPIQLSGYQLLGPLGAQRIDEGAPSCGQRLSP